MRRPELMFGQPDADRDRACGALLGTFLGDALGMPFEGAAATEFPARVEMVAARRGRGTYTHDTQMMIALAESLIEHGRVEPQHLARAFRDAYDPGHGCGGGTRPVLELWAAGTPVADAARQVFEGQGSRGDGAAMRVAPVGVRFATDPDRLRDEAARSAQLTHAHPSAWTPRSFRPPRSARPRAPTMSSSGVRRRPDRRDGGRPASCP